MTSIFLTTGSGNPPLTILVRDLNLHLLPLLGSCHAQAIPKAKAPRHGRATDMWMLDEPRILLDLAKCFLNISSSLEDHVAYLQAMEINIHYIYIYDYICFLQYIIYTYSAYFEFSPANKIPIKGFSFTKNLWFHGTFMSRCPRRGIMAFCGLVVALLLDWAGLCWLCWFCIFICSYHKTKIYVYIYIIILSIAIYIYSCIG